MCSHKVKDLNWTILYFYHRLVDSCLGLRFSLLMRRILHIEMIIVQMGTTIRRQILEINIVDTV